MSKRAPKLLVEDILDSSHKIIDYTAGLTEDAFLTDTRTIDAVIRNFEIIGEAANRLPEEFKNKYPSIDWHRIRALGTELFTITLVLIFPSCGKSKKHICQS